MGMSDEQLSQFEPSLQLTALAPGDVLVRQGDPGDAMYVLISGKLEVRVKTPAGGEVAVDSLRSGATVGEMALVAGQERTATVLAAAPSELVRLSRSGFERLAETNPELREALIRQMQPRLQRVQLSGVLETWFSGLSTSDLHVLQDEVSWVHVAGGEWLYRAGDEPDGLYLLVSGRLQIHGTDADGQPVGGAEIGRGASIGELAVLDDSPRSESVLALRDSQLVRLDRELVSRHPQVMVQIARNALVRTRSGVQIESGAGNSVRTVALIAAHPGAPVARTAALLQEQLTRWGQVRSLDADAVDRQFGRDGVAQTERGDPLESALSYWLNETEAASDYLLLFDTDTDQPGAWTDRCIAQADQVLIIADAASDAEPGRLEAGLRDRSGPPAQLVLVHPDDALRPQGTARWLDGRPGLVWHHLRLGNSADAGRLARRLLGRAVGLVLSGGGARGYVHLGLIRSLEEIGIPVDMLAGTSMGALVASAYAFSQEYAFCYRLAASFGDPKKLLDRTLPLVAIAESRNVTEMFRTMFGDTRIEDMWLPFSCVSANLTRAEPVVHERGPLWEAVRASTAIPGVFTPVVHEGDVLVDGGIMNNYPVDILRERIGTGLIIGSNAESPYRNQEFDFGPSVSGWQVLRQRFLPKSRRKRYPSILGTMMRATSVSSKHLSAAADKLADLVIRYDTRDYGNLEFDRYDELIEIGYGAAHDSLLDWYAKIGWLASAGPAAAPDQADPQTTA